jgi:hypothetical protein
MHQESARPSMHQESARTNMHLDASRPSKYPLLPWRSAYRGGLLSAVMRKDGVSRPVLVVCENDV